MKKCTRCKLIKLPNEFSKHTGHKDGLSGICKLCNKIASSAYYAANTEKALAACAVYYAVNSGKIKAYKAAYHAANAEKMHAKSAAYRAANTNKCNAMSATWQKANPEKYKVAVAAWRNANPDKLRTYEQNRRARKHGAGGKLSPVLAEKLFKLQKGKCACCKLPLGNDYHMDHIMPLYLGGKNEDSNIQLLRQRCNNQKGKKHPVDFMQSRGFLL